MMKANEEGNPLYVIWERSAHGTHHEDIQAAFDLGRSFVVRGPVHEVCEGRYYAVIRDGVPMIERADTGGAVLHIECDPLGAVGD